MYYANPELSNLSSVIPIPELKRTDGDTALKLIGLNGMRFIKPVEDPLYSAHIPMNARQISSDGKLVPATIYGYDTPLKAIGCLQQVTDSRLYYLGSVTD